LQFVRDELSANSLGIDDSLASGNSMTVFEDVFAMMERFSGVMEWIAAVLTG